MWQRTAAADSSGCASSAAADVDGSKLFMYKNTGPVGWRSSRAGRRAELQGRQEGGAPGSAGGRSSRVSGRAELQGRRKGGAPGSAGGRSSRVRRKAEFQGRRDGGAPGSTGGRSPRGRSPWGRREGGAPGSTGGRSPGVDGMAGSTFGLQGGPWGRRHGGRAEPWGRRDGGVHIWAPGRPLGSTAWRAKMRNCRKIRPCG